MKKMCNIVNFIIVICFVAVALWGVGNVHQLKDEISVKNDELIAIQEDLSLETTKSENLSRALEDMQEQYATLNTTLVDLKTDEYEFVYMGNFKITYYCDESRKHICGSGNHMTASGKPTEVGWTAAANWNALPNGSIVYISGIGYREIMDVGGSVNGNHIDVLVQEHQEALNLGLDYEDVWVLVKKS